MGSRAEKNALFEAIALMGKAFASPVRLELLDLVAQAPRVLRLRPRRRVCREHVATDHPEMQRTDEQPRERIAADAYEAATI